MASDGVVTIYGNGAITDPKKLSSYAVKVGLAQMLRGGVIMDVVNAEQARIAEEAGAAAVMALERVPADIRAQGGVARMTDPGRIKEIKCAVTIPVMAKARIGHFVEAQILEAIGVDYIDESEVLTPADDVHHINKHNFRIPFVCGCRNLGEALRRIAEGAAMIRTKGEAGTGNIIEAVRHVRSVLGDIRKGERNIDSDILAGLAVAVTVDGSRPFLIEIQALCCSGVSIVRRFNGVQEKRADMIIAVLIKQAGLKLQDSAIFLNVVGGVRLKEPAGDLAIAASICSSFLEIPIPGDIAFIGEIGLAGELRMIGRLDKRINELARLGFTKCIIPKSSEKSINGLAWEGISVISCKNVKEVINTVFQNPQFF